MNARDILMYGDRTFQTGLGNIPERFREEQGVCGWWAVKHLIAHLASFEQFLVEALDSFVDQGPTPTMNRMRELGGQGFNDYEVTQRQDKPEAELLDEYNQAHARTLALVARIPSEKLREAGAIPWYGAEYALDDLIVYQYYGHKREHTAQIDIFRDKLRARGDL